MLLSVTVSEAVRFPRAVGVKVTLMVQLALAASALPHVLVCAKSPGLVPTKVRLLMVRGALPVLPRVMDWAELVPPRVSLTNVRLEGEMPATGALPVPVKLTVCGLPAALSAMLTEAVRLPMAAGVNVTLMVQFPPADTEEPHVLVTAKSPGSAPVVPILLIVKLPLPVLVRVTDCAALVVPGFWFPKLRVDAERVTAGAVPAPVPVPVKLTVCGLLAALSVKVKVAARLPAIVGVKVTLTVQLPPAATDVPQVLV